LRNNRQKPTDFYKFKNTDETKIFGSNKRYVWRREYIYQPPAYTQDHIYRPPAYTQEYIYRPPA
jgi:bisphosphoglycerate-dependent phosphoglycerate mutase